MDGFINKLTNLIQTPGDDFSDIESSKQLLYSRITKIRRSLVDVACEISKNYGALPIISELQPSFEEVVCNILTEIEAKTLKINENGTLSPYGKVIYKNYNDKINAFLQSACLKITDEKTRFIPLTSPLNLNNRKIFIVYGHNHDLRNEVQNLLSDNLFNPIILDNEINEGSFLLEKFQKKADECSYAVVLMTADDFGKATKQKSKQVRARQNVIFELGYLISRLGRNRIFILKDQGVEDPSDISGLVYNPTKNFNWQSKVLEELYHLGFKKLK